MIKRVAMSVESMDGLKSILYPRFGRALAYVVVDVETNTVFDELENKSRRTVQEVGIKAAKMMANNNVEAVISGRFGPKAFQTLENFRIEMWIAPEGITVNHAVHMLRSGNLNREISPEILEWGGDRFTPQFQRTSSR